ncbi:MAG: hypothetical protein ROY99_06355 [Ignavibacterium sp.]|nr:hypothetical protein [Ignavibacterium sp.]
MLLRFFISLLIISILNLGGCYYSAVMNKEELDKGNYQLDFNEELFCTTNDSTRYHFAPGNFSISNDSLFGKGAIESLSPIIPFKGSIPIKDITSFEQKKFNNGATIGLVAGVIVVGVSVFTLRILSEFEVN